MRLRNVLIIVFVAVLFSVILVVSGIFIILLINSQQSPQQLIEEINYSTYSSRGFSVKYPSWNDANQNPNAEVDVSIGICTVVIDTSNTPPKDLYSAISNVLEGNENVLSLNKDDENLFIDATVKYQDIEFLSKMKIEECNFETHSINVVCVKEFSEDENVRAIYDEVFNSSSCSEKTPEYLTFEEGDFEISYPEWQESLNRNNETVFMASSGACSVIVNKYNALPGDLFNWIISSAEQQEGQTILDKKTNGNVYEISYTFPYANQSLISNAKILYCNYQSYMSMFVCREDLDSGQFQELKKKVLESVQCKRYYEIKKPEIPEKVIEENPEEIEVIDDIVKTNAGDEFGIDEEAIVYFFNENPFFRKVLSDFSKVNLVFEDKENDRELKLRASISDEGRITLLEDGNYDDADVTIIAPLIDALNVINNAENINPLNFISFTINSRTEPPNIKNEVIQKVLRGEYN